MAKNTSGKETMLTNIRNALMSKTKQPFTNIEAADNIYNIPNEELDVLFAQEFINVNGEFIFCENEKECIGSLKELITQKEWKHIIANEKKLIDLFDRNAFINYESTQDITYADAGIILCEALVARTGSILISSKQALGRTLSVYPTYCIVIASTKQLVTDMQEALSAVRTKYNGNMPSMISFATGPSRTADIEKTLVLGAHGPRGVYVFLIDNWGS